MKAFINYIADPVYSFTIVTILYIMMIKKVEWFAQKSVGLALMIGTVVSMILLLLDDVFLVNFMITTDNVPIIYLLLIVAWTTWYSIYRGIENDKRIAAGEPPLEGTPENREKVWAWPNLVYTELFVMIACTVFLIAWAVAFKSPLEEPANPTWAPNPAKAPWYFLGLQEMLVYFDPWLAGVVLPGLIVVGLIAIPYLDINPKGNGYYTFKERKFAITTFLYGWLVLWIFLIIVGTAMRGPNWTFYGPFEVWDAHKLVASNNINVSEIFWIRMLGKGLPSSIMIRELPGLLLTFIYFVALPVKMYLRWFLNLKYIVSMPEFEFNI